MSENNKIDPRETMHANLIAAASGLQQCTKTAASVTLIPGGNRVIAIGTPAEVRGMLTDAASGSDEKVCTCPSGDGSLRWPCPVHPPKSASESDGTAAADPTDEMLDMLGRVHPLAMPSTKDSTARSYERLRRAFCRQQPWPVPDQACIVWRADLMRMSNDLTHKQAFFDHELAKGDGTAAVNAAGQAETLANVIDYLVANDHMRWAGFDDDDEPFSSNNAEFQAILSLVRKALEHRAAAQVAADQQAGYLGTEKN